jgi:hypothetical protein
MRLLALAPFLSLALSASITHEFEERAGSCKSPAIRVEWRRMKSADKAAYVAAEKCLMGKPSATDLRDSTSRFEDLQVVHQNLTNYVHGNSVFLPWHRYFLHMHETLLRTECSYKGPMPWWDETLDHGKFEQSGLFTKDYFGTTKVLGPDSTPECVTDGVWRIFYAKCLLSQKADNRLGFCKYAPSHRPRCSGPKSASLFVKGNQQRS